MASEETRISKGWHFRHSEIKKYHYYDILDQPQVEMQGWEDWNLEDLFKG